MGYKGVSTTIILFFLLNTLSCGGGNGRPASDFETPGPVAIGPNIISGEGQALFVGGMLSHLIYGVDLVNYNPLDINGDADGNTIDNLDNVNFIAIGSDGRFLFTGSRFNISVYDLSNPGTMLSQTLDGWLTSLAGDILNPARVFATTWNGSYGALWAIEASAGDVLVMNISRITFADEIPLSILIDRDSLSLSPPLLYLVFLSPPAIRAIDYSLLDNNFIRDISLPYIPRMARIVNGGNQAYVLTDSLILTKFDLNTGAEVIQEERYGQAALPMELDVVPTDIALLPATSDYSERIVISDGKGYADFYDSQTSCPVREVSYTYAGFADSGEKSDTRMENITLNSCNARSEDWTVTYLGALFDSARTTGSVNPGEDIFSDSTGDFVSLDIQPGDRLSIQTPELAGEYTITEVIDSKRLRIDHTFSIQQTDITYQIKGYPYLTKGSVSGTQKARAVENNPYISDLGGLGFTIISGESPATEGDTFFITTSVQRILLEGLPLRIAIGGDNLVYVSNYASNSISVIDPTQLKVIDTLR